MNIAILLGIDEYQSEQKLPACIHDVNNIRSLLEATGKYSEILFLSGVANAGSVKNKLREFFIKYQNKNDIEEVFFYFSGHGVHHNDEALLCCSDFDYKKPATTSIGTGELDDLIRSVSPEVAVKVIDACQSGSPYIKDSGLNFEKAFSKSPLKSFICMASSRQDQSSFATSQESFFTSAWINAALSKKDGAILYRDIQASLADAFVDMPDQTPFFVSQGSGLEVFGTVTDAMHRISAMRFAAPAIGSVKSSIVDLIAEAVKEKDKAFVAQEAVLKAVESSKLEINAGKIEDDVISKFYSLKVLIGLKLPSLPNVVDVAKFAKKNSWEKNFFVNITNEKYQVKIHRNSIAAGTLTNFMYRGILGESPVSKDDDYIVENRMRPINIESTENLPFEVAELVYASTHPSLPEFRIYIGLVHSLTDLMTLSATVRLLRKGWESKSAELSDVSWRYHTQTWQAVVDAPFMIWKEAKSRGEAEIRSYLESLAPKAEDVVETEGVGESPNFQSE